MTTIYQDNFDTDTAGQIAPGWVAINGTWQVGTVSPYSGAQSFGDASNTAGTVAVYTGAAAQADFILSLVQKVADLGISNSYYVGFRGNAGWTQGYLFALENDGTGLRFTFFKRSGTSYTMLGNTPANSINFVGGDFVSMEVKGTGSSFEFRVWKAGTTRPSSPSFSFTDSSYASGFPALYRGCDGSTPLAVDNIAYADQAAAAGVTYPVTSANVYFSPFNWYSDGTGAMQGNNVKASSTYAWCNMRGGYLKFKATVGASGSIALGLNTTTLSNISAAGCPQIAWSISAGAIQSRTLVTGDTSLSLATGLAAGTYDVFVWFRGVFITQDGGQAQNYTTPNNRFQVTGVTLSAGGTLSAPTIRSKTMIAYGDSITEGDLSNGGPRSATSQDTSLTYGWLLAEALDAEVGVIGFYGMNWAWFDSTWSNYATGLSRLVAGKLTPAPDYITINYGENDGNPGPASSTVTATLAAVSAAAPTAKIISLIPFSGRARTNLSAATLPSNGYRIDLAPPEMVNGALVWSYDGQHPNQRGHANLASLLSYSIQTALGPAPLSNGVYLSGQRLKRSANGASALVGKRLKLS